MKRKDFKKLKIGTKVKIRTDLFTDSYYGSNSFVRQMEQFKGKWCTISYIHRPSFSFDISEDPENYTYTIEMIQEAYYFIFGR